MTEDEIIKTIKENIDKVELKFNSVIIIDFTHNNKENSLNFTMGTIAKYYEPNYVNIQLRINNYYIHKGDVFYVRNLYIRVDKETIVNDIIKILLRISKIGNNPNIDIFNIKIEEDL